MIDILISFEELAGTLEKVLLKNGFDQSRARECALLFATTDLDGVRSHGINRFPLFLDFVKKGLVDPAKKPEIESSLGVFERWNGQLGAGNLNAAFSMGRAIELSEQFGIGCVALRNTNHWMRGGSFGWLAVDKGKIGICFTNTKPNMPAWGGSEPKLGNNPLIIGIPRKSGPVVLDMAMSQFSNGRLSLHAKQGQRAPFAAGFDQDGKLTDQPDIVLQNSLALPAGMWKGAGLALVLDMLASLLSGGESTHELNTPGQETGVSQFFLCFDPEKLELTDWFDQKADEIISDLKSSTVFAGQRVFYPGENVLKTRRKNQAKGIPVDKSVWDLVLKEI